MKLNQFIFITFMIVIQSQTIISFQKSNQNSNQNSGFNSFRNWLSDISTSYSPAQQKYRRAIFQSNLKKINEHNSKSQQTYKMGLNKFSALTDKEFKLLYLSGLNTNQNQKTDNLILQGRRNPSSTATPTVQIDWTTRGGVTAVRDQGQCGSCWSFSAVAVIQSYNLIKSKLLTDYSEQQLIDCSSSYGNQGCNGGWPSNGLKYVRDKGISTESQYPYKEVNQACKRVGGRFKISTINYASGCAGLQSTILKNPISVGVDATNWSYYNSGIFNNCENSINHAVLLVGIVSGNWKIKNSWGTGWGQSGYIRLAAGNTCGICNYAGEWVQ